MQLIRSWPRVIPPNRAHVIDDIPRLVMSDLDYRPAFERDGVTDDLILLEWDIAVGKEELQNFADLARQDPSRVLVAPYRIYAGTKYPIPRDIWAHRHWDGTTDPPGSAFPRFEGWTPVATGDPYCNLFGFGMIYLPAELIRAFLAAHWSNLFGDAQFSMWHYLNVEKNVPISWETPAVHLNYEIESI